MKRKLQVFVGVMAALALLWATLSALRGMRRPALSAEQTIVGVLAPGEDFLKMYDELMEKQRKLQAEVDAFNNRPEVLEFQRQLQSKKDEMNGMAVRVGQQIPPGYIFDSKSRKFLWDKGAAKK